MGKRLLSWMAAALLLAVLLSGCSGGTDAADNAEGTDEDPGLVDATATTGGIRGVVVDDGIRPLAGVTVQVTAADRETTTDANGFFILDGLEPGAHLVKATHPLYETQQLAATVVAGVRDPEVLRFQLAMKTSDKPYFNTLRYQGFITCSVGTATFASEECGEGVGVPCDVPEIGCERVGGNADNQVQFDFWVDGPAVKTIVVEQVWTPNSEQTGRFYTVTATNWTCDPVCGGNELNITTGSSPLYGRVDADKLADMDLTADTRFSTFTWPDWGDACADTSCDPAQNSQANAAVNQDFDVFVTLFYHAPAPPGWSFVEGSPSPY